VINPDDPQARHIALVGDTYTILVSGAETDGRYCAIDMLVRDGGGPPPHRHDFEEMFSLLEGALEFTFKGQDTDGEGADDGQHPGQRAAPVQEFVWRHRHLLCMCTPAGQEEFFKGVAVPVASRDT
jgi:hypothetical protein